MVRGYLILYSMNLCRYFKLRIQQITILEKNFYQLYVCINVPMYNTYLLNKYKVQSSKVLLVNSCSITFKDTQIENIFLENTYRDNVECRHTYNLCIEKS